MHMQRVPNQSLRIFHESYRLAVEEEQLIMFWNNARINDEGVGMKFTFSTPIIHSRYRKHSSNSQGMTTGKIYASERQ